MPFAGGVAGGVGGDVGGVGGAVPASAQRLEERVDFDVLFWLPFAGGLVGGDGTAVLAQRLVERVSFDLLFWLPIADGVAGGDGKAVLAQRLVERVGGRRVASTIFSMPPCWLWCWLLGGVRSLPLFTCPDRIGNAASLTLLSLTLLPLILLSFLTPSSFGLWDLLRALMLVSVGENVCLLMWRRTCGLA